MVPQSPLHPPPTALRPPALLPTRCNCLVYPPDCLVIAPQFPLLTPPGPLKDSPAEGVPAGAGAAGQDGGGRDAAALKAGGAAGKGPRRAGGQGTPSGSCVGPPRTFWGGGATTRGCKSSWGGCGRGGCSPGRAGEGAASAGSPHRGVRGPGGATVGAAGPGPGGRRAAGSARGGLLGGQPWQGPCREGQRGIQASVQTPPGAPRCPDTHHSPSPLNRRGTRSHLGERKQGEGGSVLPLPQPPNLPPSQFRDSPRGFSPALPQARPSPEASPPSQCSGDTLPPHPPQSGDSPPVLWGPPVSPPSALGTPHPPLRCYGDPS